MATSSALDSTEGPTINAPGDQGAPGGDPGALSTVEWARWRAFTFMSRQVMRAVETRLQQEAGVSGPDFEILSALSEADDGQARAKDLADMLSWEKSRISHQVTRMVNRGLVARASCGEDLRGSWVRLTPQGSEALGRALPHYAFAVRDQFLAHLDDAQVTAMTQAFLSIGAANSSGACKGEAERIGRDAG